MYVYTYTYTDMGTKTISIMDDVYNLLLSRKRDRESFSDELRRFLNKDRDIMRHAGVWKDMSNEEAESMKDSIKQLRKKSTKELLKNIGKK